MNELTLNGTWKLRWSDGQRGRPRFAEREETDERRYIDASVPGEVHLDLLRAGLISSPYVCAQARDSRWVEDQVWSYRRFFDAPPEALDGRAWLHFQALDLGARIVLNGEQIATHQNVFYPCRVEVTGKLKSGRNLLTVHVESGLFAVSEKPHRGYQMGSGFDQELHKRHWLRKPQSQFSWDWSPRLINVGVSGEVRLEWTDAPVRLDQFTALVDVAPDLDRGTVRGRFFLEKLAPAQGPVEISIFLDGREGRVEQKIELQEGVACYEIALEVSRPDLWWPRGHGPQKLHTLHAGVSVGGKTIEQRTRRIGFRRVRVNQEPHPQSGQFFVFKINNRPVFLKGANLVPGDIIFAAMDRARYEGLVERAVEANFNFFRVWGGGLYESEDFYDLCDERGIVVWQEFIYACGKYPLHEQAFLEDAKREAIYQIRRLAHRASLIAWCGNNEIEWLDNENGLVHTSLPFFRLTLPRILLREDPNRYYQPSSPTSPGVLDPNRDDVGDQHPWSIGFHNVDFYGFREMICRFPNEGGLMGPTTLPTLLSCLPEGQRYTGSLAWHFHDNSIDSWEEPGLADQITEQWLGRNIRDFSVEEFAYWGGLLQGEAVREYIESFRRKMFSSGSACFWMFNDCWPAVRSWTIVDHALRYNPGFYPVRRAFATVQVALACEGGEIRIYGINDSREPFAAELEFGVVTLKGDYPLCKRENVTLAPNASTVLARFPSALLPDSAGAFAFLHADGKTCARNRLFVQKFREMQWPAPRIEVVVKDGTARFHSETFVWGVCLDLSGGTLLSDNFFDLYPHREYAIEWPHPQPPHILHTGNLPCILSVKPGRSRKSR